MFDIALFVIVTSHGRFDLVLSEMIRNFSNWFFYAINKKIIENARRTPNIFEHYYIMVFRI